MDCTFAEASQRLEKVVKTNKTWCTRDTKTTRSSFSLGTSLEQAKLNHEILQELARINTNVGLLIN